MPSTFFGLQTAVRGLRAQQRAVEVVNHNVANANTPGYSRQVASMEATSPYTVPTLNRDGTAGQIGTGVEVTSISRVRDTFVDLQLRKESATLGRWSARRDGLGQVEAVLAEPSSGGLSTLLGRFWSAWQTVSNSPDDPGARGALIEQGKSLASAIQYAHEQLGTFRQLADRQVGLAVGDINDLAVRIADLNAQIARAEMAGDNANDLADQRDRLIDELNVTAKVSIAVAPNGPAQIFLANRMLVDGAEARALAVTTNPDGTTKIVWSDTGDEAMPTEGRLRGLIEQRDVVLPRYISDLDALARHVVEAVNVAHRSGYGLDDPASVPPAAPGAGRDFFSGTGAADIAVSADVADQPRNVCAASAAGAAGDGANATAIAGRLKSYPDPADPTRSISIAGEYESLIARLGVEARTATETVENQTLLVDQLKARRESLSGVSLDEETVNLLKYQQAYQASARVISAIDDMLETLINLGR